MIKKMLKRWKDKREAKKEKERQFLLDFDKRFALICLESMNAVTATQIGVLYFRVVKLKKDAQAFFGDKFPEQRRRCVNTCNVMEDYLAPKMLIRNGGLLNQEQVDRYKGLAKDVEEGKANVV